MKKMIFLLFAVPFLATAQTEKVQSKIEGLTSKSGTLLKKEFFKAGKLTSYSSLPMEVEGLKITDLRTQTQVSGLRLSTSTSTVFVDQDELEGLLFSLNKMKEITTQPTPSNYTEYVFISKTGFRAIIYSDEKKGWIFSIELDKYNRNGSSIYFEKGNEYVNKLFDLITSAKATI